MAANAAVDLAHLLSRAHIDEPRILEQHLRRAMASGSVSTLARVDILHIEFMVRARQGRYEEAAIIGDQLTSEFGVRSSMLVEELTACPEMTDATFRLNVAAFRKKELDRAVASGPDPVKIMMFSLGGICVVGLGLAAVLMVFSGSESTPSIEVQAFARVTDVQGSGSSTTPANPPSGKGGDDNANGEGPNDNQVPEEPQVPDDPTTETNPDPAESKEPGHPSHRAPSQPAQRPPDDEGSPVALPEQETVPPPVVDPRCEYAEGYTTGINKQEFARACSSVRNERFKAYVPPRKTPVDTGKGGGGGIFGEPGEQIGIPRSLSSQLQTCIQNRKILQDRIEELESVDKATFKGKAVVSHKFFALVWSGEGQPTSWIEEIAEEAGVSAFEQEAFTEALVAYVERKGIDLDEAIATLTCVKNGLEDREKKQKLLQGAIDSWEKFRQRFINEVNKYEKFDPKVLPPPDDFSSPQFKEPWKRAEFKGDRKDLTIGRKPPPKEAYEFAYWILRQLKDAKKHLEKTNPQAASEEDAGDDFRWCKIQLEMAFVRLDENQAPSSGDERDTQ